MKRNDARNEETIIDVDSQGKPADYQRFRTFLENRINQRQKNYVDYSINDLQIEIISLEDKHAQAKAEYKWKGFNLSTLKVDSGTRKISFDLKKEGNDWKVIRISQD